MESPESNPITSEIVVTPYDILFECPNCDKSMVIDEAAAGMMVECPQCHANVIVPPRESAPADDQQRQMASESLLLAAQRGSLEGVNDALEQGADADVADPNGTTALMLAAEKGSEDCIQALILAGANPEARRADGQTAATLAQRASHFHVVRLLWKAGGK